MDPSNGLSRGRTEIPPIPTSSPYWNPTSQQLRRLVLDYLSHHCYVNTAKVLAKSKNMDSLLEEKEQSSSRESDIDGDGEESMEVEGLVVPADPEPSSELDPELFKITLVRAEIRDHILEGRIDAARKLLEAKFPRVLEIPSGTRPQPSPVLYLQSLHSPPHPSSSSPSTSRNTPPAPAQPRTESAFSLDPRHLSINLFIQEFIESVRTVPLSKSHPHDPESVAPMVLSVTDQARLITHAQQLHLLANQLPSKGEQSAYQEELTNVCALMAYQLPEESPVGRYLSMGRREAIAEQINCAILYRTGQNPIPYLQRYAEQTAVVFDTLEELGIPLPPSPGCPPEAISILGQAKLKSIYKQEGKTPPKSGLFDFYTFVSTKLT
ncbi:hypothetical protein M407DRAFT_185330 [Tulasnella calospora MUT 4182]|uniref:CRA domain-containing protein n=1 Tax=Tulasnella calospora MUT 4182 TaxID=1051891 RepID=A0A0C3M2P2_9AGAM|nr:hypothetical protein M407DRAFT_185330 [Tulasnella calospora MUT 4182]